MPSRTPLSRTASATSSVMSRTASPPSVRSCRSPWNTFIGGHPIHRRPESCGIRWPRFAVDDVEVRRPTLADADAVASLLVERDRVDFGEVDGLPLTGDLLRNWWGMDEPRLATDVWVAVREGQLVGYASVRDGEDLANLADESCVHPAARGVGIGSRLLDLSEEWARDRGLARFHAHVVNEDGRRLVERRGHRLVRYFWRMEITVEGDPSEPEPPAGVTIRGYRPGEDDEALHATVQRGFAEHWEFAPETLEEWMKRTRRSDYHPSLWRVAEEQGEIIGAALCFGEDDSGWVLELAVRPES